MSKRKVKEYIEEPVEPVEEVNKKEEIIDYKPKRTIQELDGTKPLIQLVNETFIIEDVKFFETPSFTIAKVMVKDKGAYRTTSEVLIKQLKEIKQLLEQGKKVRVTLAKVKQYYTFT
jgi:hypothetical protein